MSKKKKKQRSRDEIERMSERCKALGDPMRLQILEIIRKEEIGATDLLERLPIVQSTLSHHMKTLVEAEVVHCRKDGRKIFYSINEEVFKVTRVYLKSFLEGKKKH